MSQQKYEHNMAFIKTSRNPLPFSNFEEKQNSANTSQVHFYGGTHNIAVIVICFPTKRHEGDLLHSIFGD